MTAVKSKSILLTVTLTALVSALLSGGLFYLFSPKLEHHDDDVLGHDHSRPEKAELWTCSMHPMVITREPGLCPICNMELIPKRAGSDSSDIGSSQRHVAYWRAPMDPLEIYAAPGKSKMGMDLVPVYEDEIVGGVAISIDPATVQNMGLRTRSAERSPLVRTIRTYGHVTADETKTAQISPKVSGWIEALHVDFTGSEVKKGDPLLEIYSPELVSAQEEYLSVYRRMGKALNYREKELLTSARHRLLYFDVAPEEIRQLENSGQVKKSVLIRSPFSGIVTFKQAVQGSFVRAGTRLYTISDLSRIWVEAHIYEYELDRIETGQTAFMQLPYLPGKSYEGKVSFIYPYLQPKTRDIIIRLEFDNPDLGLKPEMFGDVMIKTDAGETGITIPSEAVIRSGERNIVFVARGNGRFTPRSVTLGSLLDDSRIHVLSGIVPGNRVVTSGQFLLDSESKLREAIQKMMTPGPRSDPAPASDPGSGFFDEMETGDDSFFKDMEP